ncbi:MAG: substrate-binding domain-containing protein, partial [Pontimonas sp.]
MALVVSATFALSACAGNADSGSGAASRSLIGAGASSQGAAQEAWVAGFQTENPEVTVTYDPIGSGGGRETFQSGASSFAGSARAFKVDEIAEGNFGSCV